MNEKDRAPSGVEEPKRRPDESLNAPVAYLKGVGPARAEALAKLGLNYARDLLFYFPRDYVEITVKRDPALLDDASVQSLVGAICGYRTFLTRRGPLVKLNVEAAGKYVECVWFNASYVARNFAMNRPVMLTGKPRFVDGKWQFSHPSLAYLDADLSIPYNVEDVEASNGAEESYVLPTYPLTEGIAQAQLQRIIRNALAKLPDSLREALPASILQERDLPTIAEAVRQIHFPNSRDDAERARRRFAYQELLVLELALQVCKTRRRVNMKAIPLGTSAKIDSRSRALFPFEFTEAQNAAVREIVEDMRQPTPMNRLLQGDVGTGKTAVAIYAALVAVANGAQAAIMAPTESLARQHFRLLVSYLSKSAVAVAPLFGGQTPAERAKVIQCLEDGRAQIVVGTQALVCNEINFHRLGLVVIDEQHKFGVKQRASLKASANQEPHYLVMTATPIPRSVTMTLFGDLDVTTMRGAPAGRRQAKTSILTEQNRASWWQFVREQLQEGRQAYVIAPRVDDSGESDSKDAASATREPNFWDGFEAPSTASVFQDSGDVAEPCVEPGAQVKTVKSLYKELSEGELKGWRVDLLHGRMSSADKDAKMSAFRAGKIDVLVATTVVEVGVDVPNATLMLIENADRFGLAQLHQLRGRVVRGSMTGYCAVAPTEYVDLPDKEEEESKTPPPGASKRGRKVDGGKSNLTAEEKRRQDAYARLEFFASTTDGFELAEKDFELRGPGELFGARQHGAAALRVASLTRDREILELATSDARAMVAEDPGLANPERALLRRQALARYGRALDLGDVG